jgi:Trypsin-like peptidase domain
MTNAELLIHNTIRLECLKTDGSTSLGTGFFFTYIKTTDTIQKFVIVTNNHVVANSVTLTFSFTKNRIDGAVDYGSKFTETLPISESQWIKHPDNNVDLCILPFDNIYKDLESKHGHFAFFVLDKDLIATPDKLETLRAIEDITMIGYPIGLWDSHNNMPLVRKGITATHPKLDYHGKKEIIIDAACFPGSSGSPILLFNEGGYVTKEGHLDMQTRVILLGILYAGPQHSIEGTIVISPIATETKIPVNLGYVIKSELLLDFEKLF